MVKRGKYRVYPLALPVIAVFLAVSSLLTGCQRESKADSRKISVFAGSASKPALEEAAERFEKKEGIHVILHFSGSGTVLSEMKMSKQGDLYIPGSPDYMMKAEKEGLVRKNTVRILAYLVPSIIVGKGNPRGIMGLKDLSREGIRVAIGNPQSVCVGLYAVEILKKAELLPAVGRNIVTFAGSCSKTAALVPMKAVDAIIGWRVFSGWNHDTTEAIPIEPSKIPRLAYIPAGISVFSKQVSRAAGFIEFLAGREGQAIFKKWGYLATAEEAYRFAPNARIGGEYRLNEDFTLLASIKAEKRK